MDLSKLEENILSLEDYPVEKWNPKLCEGVEFEINSDAEWFYNGSKIERIKMVQLNHFKKHSIHISTIDNLGYR